MQQPARERLIYGDVVSQCGEHVVNEPAVVVDVAGLVADHPRHPVPLGQLDQRGGERRLVAARVVQLHFDREPVAEDVAPLTELVLCSLVVVGAETGCDRPGRRTGQHLQSFTPLRYLLPGDARASARLFSIPLLPRREITHARPGDERSEIIESLLAPSQKSGGASIDHQLGADDGLQILLSCLESEADDPAQIGGIGDPESAVAERRRTGGECFRGGAAVAKGKGGTGSQLDESHSWSIPEQIPNTRGKLVTTTGD